MKLKQLLEAEQTLDYSEASTDSRLLDSELISEIQQVLVCAGYHQAIKGFSVDGLWGRLTRQALNTFKEEALLGEPNVLDRVAVEKLLSFATSEFKYIYPPVLYGKRAFISTIAIGAQQAALSPQDYIEIAKEFGVEVAAVRAVVEVESAGSGFLVKEPPPARPKILFEAHIFYRETPEPVSKIRPDLSSRNYNRSLYKGGSAEWQRLIDAMAFDPIPALRSASWGLGQVMGFNHKRVGCDSVEQMVVEAHQGEKQQARHMITFCKTDNRLYTALKSRDWSTFARIYNGPDYKRNRYDDKLAASYYRWQRRLGEILQHDPITLPQSDFIDSQPRVLSMTKPFMRGEDVFKVQTALIQQGFNLIPDKVFGPGTKAAVTAFQSSKGLTADGVVGAQTLKALGLSLAAV